MAAPADTVVMVQHEVLLYGSDLVVAATLAKQHFCPLDLAGFCRRSSCSRCSKMQVWISASRWSHRAGLG